MLKISRHHEIYTDGSAQKTRAGLGVWSNSFNYVRSYKLRGMIDSNRAELGAILVAAIACEKQRVSGLILTDSSTSIRLIKGDCYCEKFDVLVQCIQHVAKKRDIQLKKVKGHSGNLGNTIADALAKHSVEYWDKAAEIILPDDLYRPWLETEELIQETILANDL